MNILQPILQTLGIFKDQKLVAPKGKIVQKRPKGCFKRCLEQEAVRYDNYIYNSWRLQNIYNLLET